MKILSLFFAFFVLLFSAKAEEEVEAPLTHFSVEASYNFNGSINKHAANVGAYYWFNRKYMVGTEFYGYFGNTISPHMDFQIDLNFRKYLVDWHPYAFFVLVGPAYRNYMKVDEVNDTKDRQWNFDGLNLGFGFNYRFNNNALYVMPKINHKDAKFQISVGYRYHFNIETNRIFHKRYKLRKGKRKK